jgi:SAM-dependent methyltransferase
MTQYDAQWVKSHFDAYGQREWERWDASPVQRVKLAMHLHYLRAYLAGGGRILEIGAGPGRFTRELARISDRIVVADISPVQLRLNRQNAESMGFADSLERWVECDMCDLRPHFRDTEFDAIVCYGGPLSYVFEQRDTALLELLRVTKPGGLLFLSVMSLWGTVHHFLPSLFQIDPALNREIVSTGDLGPDKPGAGSHFCHMYRAAEFRSFLERAGVAIEALSASDCLAATWAVALEEIEKDEVAWRHLLELELEACREPGCLDMGTHIIAVCRRLE